MSKPTSQCGVNFRSSVRSHTLSQDESESREVGDQASSVIRVEGWNRAAFSIWKPPLFLEPQPAAEANEYLRAPLASRLILPIFLSLLPVWHGKASVPADDEYPATIYVTEIMMTLNCTYHKRLTETYYVLECGPTRRCSFDDEFIPPKPGTCIMILPGVRHRAIGKMKIISHIPKFDPSDEFSRLTTHRSDAGLGWLGSSEVRATSPSGSTLSVDHAYCA